MSERVLTAEYNVLEVEITKKELEEHIVYIKQLGIVIVLDRFVAEDCIHPDDLGNYQKTISRVLDKAVSRVNNPLFTLVVNDPLARISEVYISVHGEMCGTDVTHYTDQAESCELYYTIFDNKCHRVIRKVINFKDVLLSNGSIEIDKDKSFFIGTNLSLVRDAHRRYEHLQRSKISPENLIEKINKFKADLELHHKEKMDKINAEHVHKVGVLNVELESVNLKLKQAETELEKEKYKNTNYEKMLDLNVEQSNNSLKKDTLQYRRDKESTNLKSAQTGLVSTVLKTIACVVPTMLLIFKFFF